MPSAAPNTENEHSSMVILRMAHSGFSIYNTGKQKKHLSGFNNGITVIIRGEREFFRFQKDILKCANGCSKPPESTSQSESTMELFDPERICIIESNVFQS